MSLSIFIKNKEQMIEINEEKYQSYEKLLKEELSNAESNDKKISFYKSQMQRCCQQILRFKLEKEFAREDIPFDLNERNNAYDFPQKISQILSDNFHLKFHGTSIYNTAQIIPSGNLSASFDRLGYNTSYDVSGQISVTDKKTIDTTINGYTHLSDKFLPAGCVFALLPQDKQDDKLSTSLLMNNVDFRTNPNQLYAIITTTENVGLVKQWCINNNVDTHTLTFDEAVCQIEKDSKLLDFAIEKIGDKIDLSNSIDIMSAISFAEKQQEKHNNNIDELIDSFKKSEISKNVPNDKCKGNDIEL